MSKSVCQSIRKRTKFIPFREVINLLKALAGNMLNKNVYYLTTASDLKHKSQSSQANERHYS